MHQKEPHEDKQHVGPLLEQENYERRYHDETDKAVAAHLTDALFRFPD